MVSHNVLKLKSQKISSLKFISKARVLANFSVKTGGESEFTTNIQVCFCSSNLDELNI